MLGFFKKSSGKKLNYTPEGKSLYDLLQDESKWCLLKCDQQDSFIGTKYPVYYVNHSEEDIWVRTAGSLIYLKYTNQPEVYCTLFSCDDQKRLVPIVEKLIQSLKNKPFKEKLLRHYKTKCGDKNGTCRNMEEGCE